MSDDILIRAEKVSKKYCRDLKRSLFYGVQDIAGELNPFRRQGKATLRKDEFWANDEVSFEVRRGDCLGLIGRNGAGKSTLLKMLNGLVKPDGGLIETRGKVCALIELGAGFNPLLTGHENIYINGTVLGLSKQEIDDKLNSIVEFSEMSEFLHMPVQSYSSGMKVRLGFSVAVHLEPDILLLDEILAVGDTAFRAKCFNAITEISRNAAVIFVSHFMSSVSCVCNGVLVLKRGQQQYLGNDVAKGIDCYNELFVANERINAYEGRARLSGLRIHTGSTQTRDSETCNVRGGQSVVIELDVECVEALTRPAFEFIIYDVAKNPIANCSSATGGTVQDSIGPGSVRILARFDHLPFVPGRYNLTVYCVEMRDNVRRGEVYFSVEQAGSLLLSDSFPGWTTVQLVANWSIK